VPPSELPAPPALPAPLRPAPPVVELPVVEAPPAPVDAPLLVVLAGVPVPVTPEDVVPDVLDGVEPARPGRVPLSAPSEQAMQTSAKAPQHRNVEREFITPA
jgi:hypothetical protein